VTSKYGNSRYEKELYSIKLKVKKKNEKLDSYVKCLVCGAKLKQVHTNHLAKHGLTINEYLEKFPNAELVSKDYHRELSERYKQVLGKRREKVCVDCSKPFITYSPSKVRCDICQKMYELENKKIRERKRRRSFKALDQILGSGDKTTYLTILPSGRILGAVWLEEKMKKLKGRKKRYKCPVCNESYMLVIENYQAYCIDCGGKVVYAKENENYSANEFVCSHCGLVLEPY